MRVSISLVVKTVNIHNSSELLSLDDYQMKILTRNVRKYDDDKERSSVHTN